MSDLTPGMSPTRPDGSLYRWEMVVDDGTRVYADTYTELVDALVDGGYTDVDDEDLAELVYRRVGYAVRVAAFTQAEIVNDPEIGVMSDPDLSAAELDVLLTEKDVPVNWPVWESTVPLVVVDGFYAPAGELPIPAGRPRRPVPYETVWVIEVADEAGFIRSLARVGHITLFTSDPDGDAPPAA